MRSADIEVGKIYRVKSWYAKLGQVLEVGRYAGGSRYSHESWKPTTSKTGKLLVKVQLVEVADDGTVTPAKDWSGHTKPSAPKYLAPGAIIGLYDHASTMQARHERQLQKDEDARRRGYFTAIASILVKEIGADMKDPASGAYLSHENLHLGRRGVELLLMKLFRYEEVNMLQKEYQQAPLSLWEPKTDEPTETYVDPDADIDIDIDDDEV